MNMKKNVSTSPNPIKVFPKPSVGLNKANKRAATEAGVQFTLNEIIGCCDLLSNGEDQEKAREAKEAICKAAIEAIYAEADRQGLNLVEVDKAVGLATFR